jgi:hypothetical protein
MSETVMARSGSGGTHQGSGADLLKDIQSTAGAFESGDWLGGAMGVVKVGMDVLDVAGDPLGAIGSAGIGWVLGAVSFLREPFDVLKGNSGAVSSSAQSWGGSAGDLFSTADQYRQASTDQTRSWAGTAADGYRAASGNQADGLSALAQANQAVSGAMQQGGQAVAQARKTVMDLISEAVQKIIQICIEALSKSWLSFGASIALGIAQSVQKAVQTAQKMAQEIQSLIQTLQKIIQVVQKVVSIAKQVKELVEMIGGKASAEQPHTMHTQQITSTGAMATDTRPNEGGVGEAPQREVAPGYQHQAVTNASGTVGQAPQREVAPSYQRQTVPQASGAAGQSSTQDIAPGYQHQTTPVASGDTGVQTTSPAAVTTGPVTTPPVAAGAAAGGAPLTSAQPVGGAVQPPPAPARGPADWPAPPRGVPSWGPSGPPPDEGHAADRAQLQAWVQQARQILINQGVDPSLMNEDQMLALIQHESSGNPNAINLWDSNATAGHPSKGLMQTIDSTFTEHHLPGHDNIYAPVDNIIAGTRYAIDRYGSISDVPGVRNLENGRGYVGY